MRLDQSLVEIFEKLSNGGRGDVRLLDEVPDVQSEGWGMLLELEACKDLDILRKHLFIVGHEFKNFLLLILGARVGRFLLIRRLTAIFAH